METIREAILIAEPKPDARERVDSHPSPVSDPAAPERYLALQIRMTASSLAGIALIDRYPDSELSR